MQITLADLPGLTRVRCLKRWTDRTFHPRYDSVERYRFEVVDRPGLFVVHTEFPPIYAAHVRTFDPGAEYWVCSHEVKTHSGRTYRHVHTNLVHDTHADLDKKIDLPRATPTPSVETAMAAFYGGYNDPAMVGTHDRLRAGVKRVLALCQAWGND